MTDKLALILQLIISFVPVIPLLIALVKYVTQSIKDKNWKILVSTVIRLIGEAETLYASGTERKQYVVKMVMATASELKFEISEETVSDLIENIIAMTKVVNVSDETNK